MFNKMPIEFIFVIKMFISEENPSVCVCVTSIDYELSFRSNSFNSSSKPSRTSSSRNRFSLNGVASTTSSWPVAPSALSSSGSGFFKRSSVATVPVPST